MPDAKAMTSGVQVGSSSSISSYDSNIHRCSECFKELFEADRGHGSTALACEIHGFDRTIITVPKWLEESIRWNPTDALRYVAWVIDNLPY